MAVKIDNLIDKNGDTILPRTRTSAVYDDEDNRLDNILSGLTSISGIYELTLAQTVSNTTSDVSDFVTDTENYVYMPVITSSNNGTDNGTPVTIQIDHTKKVAMLARGAGVSSAVAITVTYRILKIKVS